MVVKTELEAFKSVVTVKPKAAGCTSFLSVILFASCANQLDSHRRIHPNFGFAVALTQAIGILDLPMI